MRCKSGKKNGSRRWNAGASAHLSAGAGGGAAVRASGDGQFLAVTEKGSGTIDVYQIGARGTLGQPVSSPSSGITPFVFDFVNGVRIAVCRFAMLIGELY